ncbi:hypothetical protein KIN20_002056 [Parelaphostrongylus tenuis]|uniref:Uncharacterized protein n=1 Tax=Parelaphostrongylus tenuis TaxID=148309 RepID=A0AAD5QHI1_PARTN|nr:hypothetical protein KIN20_002056 [Parelaphostrongylus tenuis]
MNASSSRLISHVFSDRFLELSHAHLINAGLCAADLHGIWWSVKQHNGQGVRFDYRRVLRMAFNLRVQRRMTVTRQHRPKVSTARRKSYMI